jgi:glyoxylase I family protein
MAPFRGKRLPRCGCRGYPSVGQLGAADIVVDVDPEIYPNGRFATLRDPENNVVQLWEPAGADLAGPA